MFLKARIKKSKKADIRTTEGFTILYETYFDYVFYICQMLLEDEATSEDITSKIFNNLWERREELHQMTWAEGSWKKYLSTAAKNGVYDHLRSQKRAAFYVSETKKVAEPSDHTTEKEIYFGELAEQIQCLIRSLPPKRKKVFQLSRDTGLTNKEIAEQLSISDHAVKKHIAKALNYIRENLEGYHIPKRASG